MTGRRPPVGLDGYWQVLRGTYGGDLVVRGTGTCLMGHGGEWQVLRETNFAALLPFERAKPQRFADFLDGAMGFS